MNAFISCQRRWFIFVGESNLGRADHMRHMLRNESHVYVTEVG